MARHMEQPDWRHSIDDLTVDIKQDMTLIIQRTHSVGVDVLVIEGSGIGHGDGSQR